jgi:undecaprenyl phosphate N,N'-diacetylbacillosamine 1-phosphate transferase
MKRALDLVIAGSALLLLSPVLLLCMAAIRWNSEGPALFSQLRLGRNGAPFRLWKLRSMYVNAPDIRNADGSAYTGAADFRVTSIGALLRSTSLDELPQLWNVLRGDMSLVGPRPDLVDQLRFYTEAEMRKLDVRPGLTGLAQISGRNAISWEARKALDVEYVNRQSFWLDLEILCRSIPYVCSRKHVNEGNPARSAEHSGAR